MTDKDLKDLVDWLVAKGWGIYVDGKDTLFLEKEHFSSLVNIAIPKSVKSQCWDDEVRYALKDIYKVYGGVFDDMPKEGEWRQLLGDVFERCECCGAFLIEPTNRSFRYCPYCGERI